MLDVSHRTDERVNEVRNKQTMGERWKHLDLSGFAGQTARAALFMRPSATGGVPPGLMYVWFLEAAPERRGGCRRRVGLLVGSSRDW